MNLSLHGKTALVTGASRGIGRACADALAAEGVRLAICARSEVGIRQAAAEISSASGTPVEPIVADVSLRDHVAKLVENAEAVLGRLDIVVLNSPQPRGGAFESTELDDWMGALDQTLLFTVAALKCVLPGMLERSFGRVIMIGSSLRLEPSSDFILSSTIRLSQMGIFKCLARDYASRGVTFNVVCPGYADTDLTPHCAAEVAAVSGEREKDVLQRWLAYLPAGRWTQPREVGDLVAFLASPLAASLTGSTIAVDGGASRAI